MWKDRKGANINSIRTKKSIQDSDVVIVKFGEKYKQWNAAFDAGYASALNKSIIVIHNEDHLHALKEVNAAASAVASGAFTAATFNEPRILFTTSVPSASPSTSSAIIINPLLD